jgi:hypothetical protein
VEAARDATTTDQTTDPGAEPGATVDHDEGVRDPFGTTGCAGLGRGEYSSAHLFGKQFDHS